MEEKQTATQGALPLTEEIIPPPLDDAMTTELQMEEPPQAPPTERQQPATKQQAQASAPIESDKSALPAWKGRHSVPAWKGQPEVLPDVEVPITKREYLASIRRRKEEQAYQLLNTITMNPAPVTQQAAIPISLESSQEEVLPYAEKDEEAVVAESRDLKREATTANDVPEMVASQEKQNEDDAVVPAMEKNAYRSVGAPIEELPTPTVAHPPSSPNDVTEPDPVVMKQQPPNVRHPEGFLIHGPPRTNTPTALIERSRHWPPLTPPMESSKAPKETDPFTIVLSPSGWGDDTHPILTKLVEMHLDSYFREGGTGNYHSHTVAWVIHRLFSEHKPIIVMEEKHKGPSSHRTERIVLDPSEVMPMGQYRSRLEDKVRECFVHAKEQLLKKRRQHEQQQQKLVAASRPTATKADNDPLMCDEQIEPYLDPAIIFHQQQQAQRLLQQKEQLLQTQRPKQRTQQRPNKLPMFHRQHVIIHNFQRGRQEPHFVAKPYHPAPTAQPPGATTVKNSAGSVKMKPSAVPGPKTPDRVIVKKRDMDETPIIANTKKKPRTQNTVNSGTTLFAATGGIVSKERSLNKKLKVAVKSASHLVKAMKQIPKPVVTVEGLTYDWSSLNLDGTAAWNRLLKQRMLDNPGANKTVPQVTAVDTYRLVQNLKDSLQTIPPPKDSPLHEALRAMPQASALQMAEDLSQSRRIRLSPAVPPPTPANCPEDIRPLYPRLAVVYNEMVAQDCLEPGMSMQQRSYQYMTADELREHMIAAEQDVVALAAKEERVLLTAKQLELFGKRSISDRMDVDDEKNEVKEAKKPVFWQEDFAALLKNGGPATRYLMVHDQF